MSVKVRAWSKAKHTPGCNKSDCGPGCRQPKKGWEVDIRTVSPDGVFIRERVWSPVSGKDASRRWGLDRERHLALEHGRDGCRCKERGEEIDQSAELAKKDQTVEQLVHSWLKQREAEQSASHDQDKQRLETHALPVLGHLKVVDVRPRHAHELVRRLKATASRRGGVLGARTVRGIFFLVKQVLQQAVLEELIPGNPVVVARGVLPPKQDKDPTWRAKAIFTTEEVEGLIADERIALHRRVAYAIEFLTGLRTGQVSALRWSDYEPDVKPLGRIISSLSWDSKGKVEKGTKTGVTHEVPVHPTLAKVLGAWKLTGWRTRMGKAPKLGDLIVPTIKGTHRDVRKALEDFHEDLTRLGLRKRRHYDARRTFISLGLDGGASKDLLQSITHPRPADAFDLYRTPSWVARCEAVLKLKAELREGRVIRFPAVAQGDAVGDRLETSAATGSAR